MIYVHLFVIMLQVALSKTIFMKLPEIKINETEIKMNLQLNNEKIKLICNNSDVICKSNNTSVCGMRYINKTLEYMEFENTCFMFLRNMCIHPGEEFYVVSSGSCEEYEARKHAELRTEVNKTISTNNTTPKHQYNKTTAKPILRSENTFSPLYEIDTAYDNHICPHSCPDTYKPECVTANRGMGKYFKFFTFVNHCAGDLYYCKHFEEFAPPDDEMEKVVSSSLGWSFCGASRYVQFAGLSEVVSSMGHYGWLAGKPRYSHIMEPHQRIPGYGKK